MEVQIAAIADMENLEISEAFNNYNIANGNLRLTLDENDMEVTGKVLVEGVPAEIRWAEKFSELSEFKRSYEIKAIIDEDARNALGIQFGPIIGGSVKMNMVYNVPSDGTAEVFMALDLKDASLACLLYTSDAADE